MSTKSSADLSRGNAYRRYKEATRAFCNGFSKLVPFTLVSVSDLAKAADHVLANGCVTRKPKNLKPSLLTPLDETIRLRQAVGATYSLEEQDDGHAYMIQVLQYCRSVLRIVCLNPSTRRPKGKARGNNKENQQPQTGVANRLGFELLNVDSDDSSDDDDGDDEANCKDKAFERPEEASKQYSIENDLIEGSWVFQANLFFLHAESLFSIVAEAYETLQQDLTLLQSSGKPFAQVNHESVVHILKATATVNLAIEHVRCLEKSFIVGREQFHSIYHLLAVLIFPDLIKKIEGILGPLYMDQNPFDAVNLASHSVRLGFFGVKVYNFLLDSIVEQMFDKKKRREKIMQVDEQLLAKIKEVCWTICVSADFERCVDTSEFRAEEGRTKYFDVQFVNAGDGTVARNVVVIDRDWLDKYSCLGGRSGVLYTFAQMEKFNMQPPSEAEFMAARDSEDGISLESTRQVVDTLLCPRLIPFFLVLDNARQLQKLPGLKNGDHGTLCMTILQGFVDSRERQQLGLEFADVFGAHALVYGVSVLSASNHAKRIAVLSRLTFQKYDTQVLELTNTSYMSHLRRETPGLLKTLTPLHDISTFATGNRGLMQALWNPLVAGSVLLTLVFHSNMEKGYGKCDFLMQIRFTLHLYNALRRRNAIRAIDLLDRLDRALATDQGIWPTGKPSTEGFLKSFLSVIGCSSRVADRMVEFLSIDPVADQQHLKRITAGSKRRLGNLTMHLDSKQRDALVRALHQINLRGEVGRSKQGAKVFCPYGISASFKYAAFMAFPREQTDEATNETNRIGAMCSQQARLVRNAIDAEHEMLSINWLQVGHLLDEFIQKVLEGLRISQLIPELQHVMNTHIRNTAYQRHIAGMFLADMVIRELEFENSIESCTNSQTVAAIMNEFFSSTARMKNAVFF